MIKKSKYISSLRETNSLQDTLDGALNLLDKYKFNDYKYTPNVAMEELGLDLDLIDQLLEDYVRQIITYHVSFSEYINTLQFNKENGLGLEYTDLRELAHKNLGVARNLRIKDAEKLLTIIMKVDDTEYILSALEALIACAIKLKPKSAYDTLSIMKIKETF